MVGDLSAHGFWGDLSVPVPGSLIEEGALGRRVDRPATGSRTPDEPAKDLPSTLDSSKNGKPCVNLMLHVGIGAWIRMGAAPPPAHQAAYLH